MLTVLLTWERDYNHSYYGQRSFFQYLSFFQEIKAQIFQYLHISKRSKTHFLPKANFQMIVSIVLLSLLHLKKIKKMSPPQVDMSLGPVFFCKMTFLHLEKKPCQPKLRHQKFPQSSIVQMEKEKEIRRRVLPWKETLGE